MKTQNSLPAGCACRKHLITLRFSRFAVLTRLKGKVSTILREIHGRFLREAFSEIRVCAHLELFAYGPH
jgi:hypothetical protein